MDFTYIPRRLIQAREDISIQHPLEREVTLSAPDDELYKLIMRLVSLKKYQVKKNALALSKKEIIRVTNYLPYNHYQINMTNLFEIFKYRSTQELCEILYGAWQDSYNNKDCNEFLIQLLKYDEKFIMLMRNNNLQEEIFEKMMNSNIPLFFGGMLKKSLGMKSTLANRVKIWGIREDSRLFKEIQFLFYTFCARDDYLAVYESTLLAVVKQYGDSDIKILKRFLINFLQELKLSELENYSGIAKYLETKTGKSRTEKFNQFFSGVDEKLVEKYINWLNIQIINEVFEYDERSRFWKQYKFLHIDKYSSNNSVVMEMKDYYATEFLGRAMGPIYFYDKKTFDDYVRIWFKYKNNADLRSLLYNNPQLYKRREVHKKPNGDEYYWCRVVHTILIRNRMTERIVD